MSKAIADWNKSNSQSQFDERIIHTGQHYDSDMSDIFFNELGIPAPTQNLEVGSGPHGAQTATMMNRLEELYQADRPDIVLNYGDTNSTLASALVAAKMHIPIAHVESGLRSFNKRMPEEINRIVTDHVARWLFCPTTIAVENLHHEGISENVFNVGDVMYDAARIFGEISAAKSSIIDRLGLANQSFFLSTIHRAENTDDAEVLSGIFEALAEISESYPVVLPLHPRTRKQLSTFGLFDKYKNLGNLRLIEPLSFLDMVALEKNAKLILTDSGGVQKEAFFHGVPCVTLRTETEWVELVECQWNVVAGQDRDAIVNAVRQKISLFETSPPVAPENLYGVGNSAGEIVTQLANSFIKKETATT